MPDLLDLAGKHILITGASSGIGRSCAVQASRLGAKVTCTARNVDGLQETVSMMACPEIHNIVTFDMSETEKIEAMVKNVVQDFGMLDGLCHAAGFGSPKPLRMTKPEFVESLFRVNTFSFLALLHCCARKETMNPGGSIVGISSVAAEQGNIYQGTYAASKAAMNGVLYPAARELASRKIRVNNVAFSMVDTISYTKFQTFGDESKLREKQLLGIIDVESAANSVMFLLSDACPYITGAVLPVYAGF